MKREERDIEAMVTTPAFRKTLMMNARKLGTINNGWMQLAESCWSIDRWKQWDVVVGCGMNDDAFD